MILDYNYKMRYCSNRHTLRFHSPLRHRLPLSPATITPSRVSASSGPNIFPILKYTPSPVLNGGLDWRVTVAQRIDLSKGEKFISFLSVPRADVMDGGT